MATTADIKNGLYIEFNDDIYTIVQFQHVKPGKGGAFVRTKLKSLTSGRVIENTFSAGHKINVTRVERRPYQFLYSDESGFTFMHNVTFEQILIQKEMIENPDLMKDGQEVEVVFHADSETVLSVELPPFVALEVTYTEPGVKGDTSSGTALKPATLETGASVMVPIFINTGEKIKIDTRDRSYSERIK
jgi:elongation factor P